MEEIWRKYEDTDYDISNLGRVRLYVPKYHRSSNDGYSYQKITYVNGTARFSVMSYDELGNQKANSKSLAKAVYETFNTNSKPITPKNTVLFIDGDNTNCRLDNLITVEDLKDLAFSVGLIGKKKES